jgi:hypothetical protein
MWERRPLGIILPPPLKKKIKSLDEGDAPYQRAAEVELCLRRDWDTG